ncbi:MAG: hypothetical protein C7B45_03305 [Sulfobacillus acidophilus]|uniref:Uncharacterized protein n=1 Tax=Sulfobacillus acidophilus TaxID=53633 RepID=A0A2T2WME7_9FIRM|nr:MAG: hypothetical protein C7B45_03305 [Sulfobacillus acidophilus]
MPSGRLNTRPGKRIVQLTGVVSIIGGILFQVVLHVPLIAGYLVGAGLVFELFTLGWDSRYQAVQSTPPEGFEPTGETYCNPGRDKWVSVWQHGIRRIYVATDPPPSNPASPIS